MHTDIDGSSVCAHEYDRPIWLSILYRIKIAALVGGLHDL